MINPMVMKALNGVGMPVYFVTRGEEAAPCIVFNSVDTPYKFSDDVESLRQYIIMLNILVPGDMLVDTVEKVNKLMTAAGFILRHKPTCMFEDELECYNQPIEYKFIKEV